MDEDQDVQDDELKSNVFFLMLCFFQCDDENLLKLGGAMGGLLLKVNRVKK